MKDAATRRDASGIDIDFLAGQPSSSTVGTVGHHVYSMEQTFITVNAVFKGRHGFEMACVPNKVIRLDWMGSVLL